jgi:lysophospholipid acyltransferase (LPLAT)-like uncharacterized protein
MFIKFVSWLFWALNYLICSTLKYRVSNAPDSPALYALWHGQSFPVFYWARNRKVCIHPTDNWRGDVLTYLGEKYGYKIVRFLERGTPLERSENLVKLMKLFEKGYSAAIAVDGPPKPMIYHKAKPGILFLCQQSNLPLIPVRIKMKKKITLSRRWDKFEIPLPWSEAEINFGKPVLPEENISSSQLEELLSQPF